jgi:hypothetical protein
MKTRIRINAPLILLLIVVVLIFGAMTYHMVNVGDYPDHLEFTKQLADQSHVTRLAHTLFAKLVIFTRLLLPFNWVVKINESFGKAAAHNSFEIAAVVLITTVYAFTAYIIWKRAVNALKEKGISRTGWISVLVTLVILLAGPITTFTYPNQQYIGYFASNPYHNPTFTLLRPFALIWFYIIVDRIFSKTNLKYLLYTALIVYLATYAKPNFTLTILPAMLVVYLLFYIKRTKEINWSLVLIGMGLVSAAALLAQYLLTYIENGDEGIIFAPFATVLYYARNYFIGSQKIVMSVAFPLVVSIIYWRDVKGRLDFRLAWINYLVGVLIAVLFAEPNRLDHANFFWCPMTGAFILFVVTVIYYVTILTGRIRDKSFSWKDLIPAIFLAPHLFYGIVYYINVIGARALVR